MNKEIKPIGKVITTSTQDSIVIRLRRKVNIEDIELGGYISIEGKRFLYICKITDIRSREVTRGTTDIQMQINDLEETGMKIGKIPLNILGGISYDVTAKPLRSVEDDEASIEPKTAPPVFALTSPTHADDVRKLYAEDPREYIEIGNLRGIIGPDVPANIILEKLMTLHAGIFGKTGSGKTYLTRVITGHITRQKDKAALIFDMHNEYGYKPVIGLKHYFMDDLIVVGLKDPRSTQKIDETLEIPRSEVTMGDVLMAVPSLSEAQKRALYVLQEVYGSKSWFDELMQKSTDVLMSEIGERGQITSNTLGIAQTEVQRFFDNLPFIVETDKKQTGKQKDSGKRIIGWLKQGKSVVVSFGTYANDATVYAVATNMISRRLLELYRGEFDNNNLDNMPNVMIVLEEAHKFLNKNNLNSSFFGKFVREARKFKLGLLIVDQSPSKIHEEVMAQLGTQFIMQLGNEKDKKAVIELSEEDIADYKGEIARLNTREGLVAGKASDFLQSINVAEFTKENMERIWQLQKKTQTTGSGKKKPGKPLGGI